MSDKVYIVLLNWNTWYHTLECLESLFKSDFPEWQIVVCDNASTDQSIEKIKAWADGNLDVLTKPHTSILPLVSPPIAKPIPYRESPHLEQQESTPLKNCPLVLLQTPQNLGFAGGNNVALQYILQQEDCGYVWLLNNDTVVQPDTLSQMVKKIQTDAQYGLCGSTVAYYHDPSKIQARGGNAYTPWIGRTKHVGFLDPVSQAADEAEIEAQMDCVLGASMLVTHSFINEIGLMGDRYFLYFEELDWALRAKERYRLAYASQSIVYHKEGGTIGGGNRDRSQKSYTADFFELRNRLLITRIYFPFALPTVCLGLFVTLFNRIRRRQWNRIGMIFKVVVDAFRTPL